MASLIKQDIDVKTPEEIAFNVHMVDGLSYFFCFLVAETEKYVVVAETTMKGTEELRVLVKNSIVSVDVVYDFSDMMEEPPQDHNDVMFI